MRTLVTRGCCAARPWSIRGEGGGAWWEWVTCGSFGSWPDGVAVLLSRGAADVRVLSGMRKEAEWSGKKTLVTLSRPLV